ncbi:MAG: OB-fold nucleic acid binding domain-containing protein [Bacilli bacterium]|nr:OB-fold nucleic acid binding domain-containing protein [Bacilli bacterium]
MKKKILSLLLIVLLTFTLTACDMLNGLGGGGNGGTVNVEVDLDEVYLNVQSQLPTKEAITDNLVLPTKFGDSVTITWVSSNTEIIDNMGRIVARPENDTEVILNCTLTSAKESKTYRIKVTIKAKDPDAVKVLAHLDASLQGTYKGDDVVVVVSESSVSITDPSGKTLTFDIYEENGQYYIEEDGIKVFCTFGNNTVTNSHGTFTKDEGGQTSTFVTLAQAKAGEVGATYKVKAVVVAVSNVSFLLKDDSGLMLAYLGANYAKDLAVGDEIELSGPTTQYSGTVQFGDASTYTKVGTKTVSHPQARVLDGEAIASLATQSAPAVEYVKISGKLSVSGNYLNVEIEGTTVKGSLVTSIDVSEFNGKKIIASGYFLYSTGSGKYVNIIATNIELDPDQGTVVPVENPTHAGSETDPFDAKDAIIVASKLNGDKREQTIDKFYITGTIIDDPTADYCNFSFQDGSNTILAYGLWNANGTKRFGSNRDIPELPVKKGDVVVLYANIQNFSGKYEMINALLLYVNGVKQEAEPVVVPTGDPVHAGSLADPYDAKDAILVASKLDGSSNAMTTDKFYVTGTIVDDPTAEYCNFNFKDGDTSLLVYGLATYDGTKRYGTSRDIAELPVKKGDVVVLHANIQNYSGKLELANAWIVSVNGEQLAPSQTDQVAKLPTNLQGIYKAEGLEIVVSESSVVVKETGHSEHNYVLYIDADNQYYVLEEGKKIICTFGDNSVTNEFGTFTKETATLPAVLDYAELDEAMQGAFENEEYKVIVRTSSIKLSKKGSDEVTEAELWIDANFAVFFNFGNVRIYCNFEANKLTTDMGAFTRCEITDEEIVADVKDILQKWNNYEVVLDPALESELNGCTIVWASTNEAVMASNGKVTLQAADTAVKFNVTVSKNNASETFEITFIVKKYESIATLQALEESEYSGFNFFATKAIVVANYVDGFLLKDETGYIVVYSPAIENAPTLGAEYIVRGMIKGYGGTNEFADFFKYEATGESVNLESPEFVNMDADMVARLSKQMVITPVELKGLLTISNGKYINITINDSTFTGSINGSVADYEQFNNKDVIVKGYLTSISGKYAYILPLEVAKDENAQGPTISPISEVLVGTVGERYSVKGIVVAKTAQSILLKDESGYILAYFGTGADVANTFEVGVEATLTGSTSLYGGRVQLSKLTYELGEVKEFTQPEAIVLDQEAFMALDAAVIEVKFVKLTGKLVVSEDEKYFNMIIGEATLQGSISYPIDTDELIALNGKFICVEGYFVYINGQNTRYANIMALAFEEAEMPDETDQEVVNETIQMLNKYNNYEVVTDMALEEEYKGTTIVWSSANEDVMGADGRVFNQSQDTTVVLSATVTKGEVIETIELTFVVKGYVSISSLQALTDLSGVYAAKGVVVATGNASFLLKDETGYIQVYVGADYANDVLVGDEVVVRGFVTAYGGNNQFATFVKYYATGETIENGDVSYVPFDGEALNGLLDNPAIQPIEIKGTLSISGQYINVVVEGSYETGSLSANASDYEAFDGKAVIVKGYFVSLSGGSSQYVAIIPMDVEEYEQGTPLPVDKDNILDASTITTTFTVNEDGSWTVLMTIIADEQYANPRFVLRDVIANGFLNGVFSEELYQEETVILKDKSNIEITEETGRLTVKVTVPANLVVTYTSEHYAASGEDGTCYKGGLLLDLYLEFYDGEEDYSPNKYGVSYLYDSLYFFRSYLDVVDTVGDGTEENPLTAADAAAIAAYLPEGIWTKTEFYIEGTVVGEPNAKYGNLLLQNGETTFTVYGLYTSDGLYQYGTAEGRVEEIPVHNGDEVLLLAQIYHYVNDKGETTLETMRAKLIQVNDNAVTYEALPEFSDIEVTLLNGPKEGYVYWIAGYRNGSLYGFQPATIEDGVLSGQVRYVCDSFRIFEYLQVEEGEEFGDYTRYTNLLSKDVTECALHINDEIFASKEIIVNEDGTWTVTMTLTANEAIENPRFDLRDVKAFGFLNGVIDDAGYLEETVLLNDKSNLAITEYNGDYIISVTVSKALVNKYASEYYYPDYNGSSYKGGIALDLYIEFYDGNVDLSPNDYFFGSFYFFHSFLDVVDTVGDGTIENPLTAADAYALAEYLPNSVWTNDEFYIVGTVVTVTPEWCNLEFQVGENTFLVYGIATADGEYKYGTSPNKVQGIPVQAGDKVLLLAQVYHFVKDGVSTFETKDARLIQVNDQEATYELVEENNAQAVHAGTADDPLDEADAYLLASKLDASSKEKSADKYYIEAVVASTPTSEYCNFNLVDGEGHTVIVYGLYVDETMTDRYGTKRQVAEIPFVQGDTVVLYGNLQNFSGKLEVVDAYLVKYVSAQGE